MGKFGKQLLNYIWNKIISEVTLDVGFRKAISGKSSMYTSVETAKWRYHKINEDEEAIQITWM